MDIDRISPVTVGEDRITVTLSSTTPFPVVGRPLCIEIAYTLADPEGCIPPIVISVQPEIGGPGSDYRRKVYNRLPSSYTFVPASSGEHLILVRESAHNRWQGRLRVFVEGDDLSGVATERR